MPVHVAQLTDLHLFADPAARLRGIPTRETLADVLDLLADCGREFDYLILTGDLADDERPQTYRALRKMLGAWAPRCRLIPGNHDDRRQLREVFPEHVQGQSGPVTFALDAGSWRLIGLDTQEPGEVAGRIEPQQLDWLKRELQEHQSRPTALFLHHPPVSVNSPWLDRIGLKQPEALLQVIRSAAQVRAVFAGHVHHDSSGRIGDASFFTTPSTGLQFRAEGEEPSYEALPPGFRIITLDDDRLETEVLRLPTVKYCPEE